MRDYAVAVLIVTYQSSDHVGETLRALAGQLRPDDQVVVVDNASSDGTPAVVRRALPGAILIEQPANLGFAAACNLAATSSTAPLMLFLNPDATPSAGCLDTLREVANERPDWAAWQALVTMNQGETINTAGNVVHYLGIGWAGRCGEPVTRAPAGPMDVGFASGAALVVRRVDWDSIGGFEVRYFMYGEDLDLGLRLWLAGRGVGVAPRARVEHDYEFFKGGRKWFLLERNRWWTVLGCYPTPLLLMTLPPLVLSELALLIVAARGGWLTRKLAAQVAVVRQLRPILARRRRIQSSRAASTTAFARRLSAELDSPYLTGVAALPVLPALQRAYWKLVLRLLDLL